MPCTICFETLSFSKVVELPCGHVLHYSCLCSLIKSRSRKCPLCRCKLTYTIPGLTKALVSNTKTV